MLLRLSSSGKKKRENYLPVPRIKGQYKTTSGTKTCYAAVREERKWNCTPLGGSEKTSPFFLFNFLILIPSCGP